MGGCLDCTYGIYRCVHKHHQPTLSLTPPPFPITITTTYPRYSSGIGAAATSASILCHTCEKSDTDFKHTGQDSMPFRCMSEKHSECMVWPQRNTEVGRIESNRNSKQMGQLWCMLFSTHLWLSWVWGQVDEGGLGRMKG